MTWFGGFTGRRDAYVRLLPLHPVATATVAGLSRNWVSHLERLPFSALSSHAHLLGKKKDCLYSVVSFRWNMTQRQNWMDRRTEDGRRLQITLHKVPTSVCDVFPRCRRTIGAREADRSCQMSENNAIIGISRSYILQKVVKFRQTLTT